MIISRFLVRLPAVVVSLGLAAPLLAAGPPTVPMTLRRPEGVVATPVPPQGSGINAPTPTPGWTAILSEDVEGTFPAANGWTVSDSNATRGSDFWDDVTCRSFAGSASVWSAANGDQTDCANYDDSMTSWMIFGPFSLTDAVDARLEFQVWSETEDPDIPYDYIFWGASTDGSSFDGERLTTNVDWTEIELDLTDLNALGNLAGEPSVWIAFVFVSDNIIHNFEGTYLDDILVEKRVPGAPPGAFTLSSLDPECDVLGGGVPSVDLTWTEAADTTSYDLYRDGTLIASSVPDTVYRDSDGLTAGQTYAYFMRAHNVIADTDSNTVMVSIPADLCAQDIEIEPTTLSFTRFATASATKIATTAAPARAPHALSAAEIEEQRRAALHHGPGNGLEYHGEIALGTGRPADGRYAVEITYGAPDTKERVSEAFGGVEVRDGRFEVALGTGDRAEGAGTSVASFFAEHPEVEMEITVGDTALAPSISVLPEGHTLESRMLAAGTRSRRPESADDDEEHWEGYRARNGATAFQAAVLSSRGDFTAGPSGTGSLTEKRNPYTLPIIGPMVSRPVRDLPGARPKASHQDREINEPRHEVLYDENGKRFGTAAPKADDELAWRRGPTTATPSTSLDFEGVGNVSGVLPPDTEGTVGMNHYVQVVNSAFAIYSKTGTLVTGPVNTQTLWSGFGGPCNTDNSGDAIFLYDQQADRYVLTQFAVSGDHQSVCFAVSRTGDPTGTYNLYEVVTPRFPDYYKVGVWPTSGGGAYFFGTNSGLQGQYDVFAVDRANMLAGNTARPVQFFQSFSNLMMPADVDGPAAPPADSPGIFYTFRDGGEPYFGSPATDSLDVWELDVDWNTPASSTMTLVESFTPADGLADFNWTVCGFFVSSCIPQPGTTRKIDSASWWPMQRLVYRNFGDHQTLVGSWTVDVLPSGDRAAPRWFELRDDGGGWSIYQQGTHSPDAIHRWMPSIAMDGAGDIALGYSRGDANNYPSLYYATRSETDTLGTLQSETAMIESAGSQTHSSGRWGDYSSMELDPADDCTFWYTSEYIAATSSVPWHTRVARFTMPGCATSTAGRKYFTIYNEGGETLEVTGMTLDSSAAWISWSPDAPFSIGAGESRQVMVTVDFDAAPAGPSTRRILVASDDADENPYPDGVFVMVDDDASGGIPDHLVLDEQTISTADVFEACLSITLGPNLVIELGSPGPVFRAPLIVFIGALGVEGAGHGVFDGSKPSGCP